MKIISTDLSLYQILSNNHYSQILTIYSIAITQNTPSVNTTSTSQEELLHYNMSHSPIKY
jgi:hypothetical protein